jgi:cell division protein FtsA
MMVARREIIAGLDVGSSWVRCAICEIDQRGSWNVIGLGSSPSEGIRKGTVVDIESTVESIVKAVDAAQRMAGVTVEAVHVGVPNVHAALVVNRGVVAVSSDDKEITEEDVDRVLQAARVISLPPNRDILDVIPRQFIIDGYDGIRSPAGMAGIRLEVEAMLVMGTITSVQNLIRCIERAGLDVASLVLNPMGLGELLLSGDERELGVVLVDIGGGTCEVCYYSGGTLQAIGAIPLGGELITSDIAYGLRTTASVAETAKVQYGTLLVASEDKVFEIPDVSGQDSREVSIRRLSGIIEARINEMLSFVAEEMSRMKVPETISSGIVITGGVAQTKGLAAYMREMFQTGVRVAQDGVMGVEDPAYATAIGVVVYALKNRSRGDSGRVSRSERRSDGLLARVVGWFKEMWE